MREPQEFYELEPAAPYDDHIRYTAPYKYSFQNMELRSVRMAPAVHRTDFTHDIWSDRVHGVFEAAAALVRPGEGADRRVQYFTDDEFLDWATMVLALVNKEGPEQRVTGARVVMSTNAGGYEVWRLDVWRKTPGSPDAPPYLYRQPRGRAVAWDDIDDYDIDDLLTFGRLAPRRQRRNLRQYGLARFE